MLLLESAERTNEWVKEWGNGKSTSWLYCLTLRHKSHPSHVVTRFNMNPPISFERLSLSQSLECTRGVCAHVLAGLPSRLFSEYVVMGGDQGEGGLAALVWCMTPFSPTTSTQHEGDDKSALQLCVRLCKRERQQAQSSPSLAETTGPRSVWCEKMAEKHLLPPQEAQEQTSRASLGQFRHKTTKAWCYLILKTTTIHRLSLTHTQAYY